MRTNLTSQEKEELIQAACQGEARRISGLLKCYDPNIELHASGVTALYLAVLNGHKDVVALLLKKGADVERLTQAKDTMLHAVVHCCNLEIADMILPRIANLDLINIDNETPLQLVQKKIELTQDDVEKRDNLIALRQRIEAEKKRRDEKQLKAAECEAVLSATRRCDVAYLSAWLSKGGDSNLILTKYGETPLLVAAGAGSEPIVRLLLEAGASPNVETVQGNTPLFAATVSQNTMVLELILAKRVNILKCNRKGNTALHQAALQNSYFVVRSLLRYGALPDVRNNLDQTPLDLAEEFGGEDVIQLLIDAIEAKNQLLAVSKIENENQDIKTKISSSYIKMTKVNKILFEQAIASGRINSIQPFLDMGANPNEVLNDFSETPLFVAVRFNHVHLIKPLLDAGAAIDGGGELTPLFLAVLHHNDCIDELMKHGASLVSPSASALHWAARGGHLPTIRKMLMAGVAPHYKGKLGYKAAAILREKKWGTLADFVDDYQLVWQTDRIHLQGETLHQIQKAFYEAIVTLDKHKLIELIQSYLNLDLMMPIGTDKVTPLFYVLSLLQDLTWDARCFDIAHLLLQAGVNPTADELCILIEDLHIVKTNDSLSSVRVEIEELIDLFFELNVNFNAGSKATPLNCAIRHGDAALVNELLLLGACPQQIENSTHDQPLLLAANKLLLKLQTSKNQKELYSSINIVVQLIKAENEKSYACCPFSIILNEITRHLERLSLELDELLKKNRYVVFHFNRMCHKLVFLIFMRELLLQKEVDLVRKKNDLIAMFDKEVWGTGITAEIVDFINFRLSQVKGSANINEDYVAVRGCGSRATYFPSFIHSFFYSHKQLTEMDRDQLSFDDERVDLLFRL